MLFSRLFRFRFLFLFIFLFSRCWQIQLDRLDACARRICQINLQIQERKCSSSHSISHRKVKRKKEETTRRKERGKRKREKEGKKRKERRNEIAAFCSFFVFVLVFVFFFFLLLLFLFLDLFVCQPGAQYSLLICKWGGDSCTDVRVVRGMNERENKRRNTENKRRNKSNRKKKKTLETGRGKKRGKQKK